jgi:hypothetical protein
VTASHPPAATTNLSTCHRAVGHGAGEGIEVVGLHGVRFCRVFLALYLPTGVILMRSMTTPGVFIATVGLTRMSIRAGRAS